MNRSSQIGYLQALQATRYLARRVPEFPRVGIVLGSGLGEIAGHLKNTVAIPYRGIPHFPRPAVAGHSGRLHIGTWGKTQVAVLAGRVHLYEGYTPAEVVFATRVLALAGAEILIFTCAAGGIASWAVPGSFMVFADHINLQAASPLAGRHDPRWGERFIDLSDAYDAQLRKTALKASKELGIKCSEGVYACVAGPNYETPSEIRAFRRLGADAVGMSTAPEVIAARQLNVQVLAIASISNRATGLARQRLRHSDVIEATKRTSRDLVHLLDLILPGLA